MRKPFFVTLMLVWPAFLFAAELTFQSPDFDSPYFRITQPFEVKETNLIIREVQLNGRPWAEFFVFWDSRDVDPKKPLAPGTYEIQCDYAWTGGRDYRMKVLFQEEDTAEPRDIEAVGRSPAEGGVPPGMEGLYRVIRAEETVGVDRAGEICLLTFTAAKDDFQEGGFRLLDGNTAIDFQILDTKECTPPEKAADHPVTVSTKIAFPLDITAHGKKMLLLLKTSSPQSAESGFLTEGEAWGKTVKTSKVAVEFHPQSGQINTLSFPQEGITLSNPAGVVHWNPGCFIPGVAWDHSFNWNPPPGFEERSGPFLFINTRRGPLQTIKDILLEVKYTLGVDWSYIISETLLLVQKDLGVKAIRNDEMVLDKELFDHLIYKDRTGQTVRLPLEEKPGFPDGFVHAAPANVDWVGLLNTARGYGFFSLRISQASSSLDAAGDWTVKPGTYFYAPSDGKYVYWVRPLVYTWSEYPTRNLLTYVPEGSFFYEKNAYILLPLSESLGDWLDLLLLRLQNPVRID